MGLCVMTSAAASLVCCICLSFLPARNGSKKYFILQFWLDSSAALQLVSFTLFTLHFHIQLFLACEFKWHCVRVIILTLLVGRRSSSDPLRILLPSGFSFCTTLVVPKADWTGVHEKKMGVKIVSRCITLNSW